MGCVVRKTVFWKIELPVDQLAHIYIKATAVHFAQKLLGHVCFKKLKNFDCHIQTCSAHVQLTDSR